MEVPSYLRSSINKSAGLPSVMFALFLMLSNQRNTCLSRMFMIALLDILRACHSVKSNWCIKLAIQDVHIANDVQINT